MNLQQTVVSVLTDPHVVLAAKYLLIGLIALIGTFVTGLSGRSFVRTGYRGWTALSDRRLDVKRRKADIVRINEEANKINEEKSKLQQEANRAVQQTKVSEWELSHRKTVAEMQAKMKSDLHQAELDKVKAQADAKVQFDLLVRSVQQPATLVSSVPLSASPSGSFLIPTSMPTCRSGLKVTFGSAKVGDRIRFINNQNGLPSPTHPELKAAAGEEFVVAAVDSGYPGTKLPCAYKTQSGTLHWAHTDEIVFV